MAKALGLANAMTVSHWETGFRKPTATALRILCLLASLPDSELKRIVVRLEVIAEESK
jgi:DNA-binding transcriptional regulator YiaG